MKLIVISIVIMLSCIGCKAKIITVDGSKNDNTTSFEAFNDESYVWESWSFSTNKVEMELK